MEELCGILHFSFVEGVDHDEEGPDDRNNE
jgi:hypothetical protein